MEAFFSVPKLLEIGFNTLSAATALFVVATALRVAPSFTLSAHRRAMRILATAAVIVVASEVVGVGAAFTRPSTLSDAVGEFAEFVAVAAAAAVLLPVSGGAGGDPTPQALRRRGRSDRSRQPLVLRAGREA
jgi:hypothetical protein